jgi:hypothetical protein
MVKAYDFFYSYQNEVPQETFEKRKKRKMKGVLFWDFSGKLRTNIYLCNEVCMLDRCLLTASHATYICFFM